MKKNLLKVVFGVIIAILLWRIVMMFIGTGQKSPQMTKPPVAVETGEVTTGPIQEIREFTGTVHPYYQYVVAPKVSGRIVEIRKRIGDFVKKGEVIARIDDAEYEQALLEAEANLKIANASLVESQSQFKLARQEFDRAQSLKNKGIASEAEYDAASSGYTAQESRLHLAEAQVEQREASCKSAKIRLSYTVLSATEPGYIGERLVDEGSLLAPNSPLATVVGIEKVIIRTNIIEKDYGLIKNNQQAEILVDAFPGRVFKGVVKRIAPMLQESSRVADMEIEAANDSLLLKPGMFAKIKIVLSEKQNALIVPSSAIASVSEGIGVFTVDEKDSTAHFIAVKTGITSKDKVEILSPEISGTVVTLGQHLLNDGSKLILPGAAISDVKKDGKTSGKGSKK